MRPGDHEISLTYAHPVTGQQVTTTVVIVNNSLVPAPGGPIEIAADPSNPDRVVVPGDGNEIPSALIGALIIDAVVAAAGLARWLSVRHAERLVSSPRPSFSMLGALTVSGIVRRRVALALYPVDAPAGRTPICMVPLLTTAGLPIDGPCFPVEVRGRPVPGGPVVARSGDEVLFPLRRPTGRGALRRPSDIADPPPQLAFASRPATARAPSLWHVLGGARLLLVVPALVGVIVIPVVVWQHWRAATDLEQHGVPVQAQVVEKLGNSAVRVTYQRDPSTGKITTSAPADADLRVVGRIYPAHASATDTNKIRLDSDAYDPVPPMVYVLVLAAFAAMLVVPLLQWQRATRKLVSEEVWREGELVVADHLGTVRAGPATGWFVAARVGVERTPVPSPVRVAGSLDPGEPVLFSGEFGAIGPPSLYRSWSTKRRAR